jgi:hypothetical protein
LAYLSIDPLDNKQVILVKEMILKTSGTLKFFKADIENLSIRYFSVQKPLAALIVLD